MVGNYFLYGNIVCTYLCPQNHHEIFWQLDPHNSTWITWKHVDFHTFPYTLHGSMTNHVDFCGSMLCGSSQGIWEALELLRFPRVSMIYDVDFPVDFLRKKFLMYIEQLIHICKSKDHILSFYIYTATYLIARDITFLIHHIY